MAAPRSIVIPALGKQTATVICLHGLGDSGRGWSFLAQNWRQRGKFQSVSFIFPNAPNIPITVNNGMRMPGWYDILSFGTLDRSDDEPGVMRSREVIHNLVNEQIASGIPANKIILGGFSQGGAISLFSGLTFKERLAGVFGLSCYQLLTDKFENLHKETGSIKPPVFMGHGTADQVVKFQYGKMSYEFLQKQGFDVNWNEYQYLEHSANEEELDQLEQWVEARLSDTA